ncbi:MAG TPA: 50S ribosomal protein L10 [Acidimicrobiales bacterium]|nr:50S ribosomal protein L10 [Acidimicrobiales bacterium]
MATQNAQMAHKVEVVDEVKTRMSTATASIVSEYRGLTVAELADLRHALAAVGGDYKIFKNTLVRRAIDGGDYQPLEEYLSGPSALTFVQGDISAVAKALRDFSRANPHLVIKGGLADGSLLSPTDLAALAELPPREVLLARLAGALAAPMTQLAGLLKALPQNLAYGISALIEQQGGVDEAAAAPVEAAEAAEAPTAEAATAEAETPETETAEAATAKAETAETETAETAAPETSEAPEAATPEATEAAEDASEAEAATEEPAAE